MRYLPSGRGCLSSVSKCDNRSFNVAKLAPYAYFTLPHLESRHLLIIVL